MLPAEDRDSNGAPLDPDGDQTCEVVVLSVCVKFLQLRVKVAPAIGAGIRPACTSKRQQELSFRICFCQLLIMPDGSDITQLLSQAQGKQFAGCPRAENRCGGEKLIEKGLHIEFDK